MSASVLLGEAGSGPFVALAAYAAYVTLAAAFAGSASMTASTPTPADAVAVSATAAGNFGLYPAADFRLTDGRCVDCTTHPAALWYFAYETIAVPRSGMPVTAFSRDVDAFDDVRTWRATNAATAPLDYPPLVWMAAPQMIGEARVTPDAAALAIGDTVVPIELAAKIPLNR